MPNIIDNPELYKSIVLGGVASPGQVALYGHNRKVLWDVKVGPFLNGAITTLKGIPPIEFSASFSLLRDDSQGIDDFADWDNFEKVINATAQGVGLFGQTVTIPKAQDIYHPDLARNDIKSVAKAEVGGFTYDCKGGAVVVVRFQEYRPPKRFGGTPIGSKTKNDPNAAAKAEIERLTQQYKNTPWG